MNNKKSLLNSLKEIRKIDVSNALGSVEALADQVRQSWQETKDLNLSEINNFNKIFIVGMGGSGIGPDVVKHLLKDKIKIPLEVSNSYTLPQYVDEQTLVILSSYSGNTEEVIAAGHHALEKNSKIIAISSGGKLAKLAKEKNWPIYIINPKNNPSNQPRMAIGNSIVGIMGMLQQIKIINFSDQEMEEAITTIIAISEKCKVAVEVNNNPAKTLAYSLYDKRPTFVVADFLSGAIHVSCNQMNENAKTFCDYKIIPEINHHLMEGLRHPKSNQYTSIFVFFQSQLYHPRNQKRINLTQQVVEKNKIETIKIGLESTSKLTQVFELITLMAYTNFYLSMLYQIDPCPIPFVDWFKTEMKK